MKKIICLLFLIGTAFTQAQIDLGNAGSQTGPNELADFYYLRKSPKPPQGVEVDLEKDYPQIYNEVKKLQQFINLRRPLENYFPAHSKEINVIPKNVKYFIVDKLSGQDPLDVTPGKSAKTTMYSRFFEKYSSDFSEKEQFHVIELLRDNSANHFFTLNPKNQALGLFHEYLHILFPDRGHNIISPYVASLRSLLLIWESQRGGTLQPLSKSEILASKTFQNISTELFRYSSPLGFTVNPYGGIIYAHPKMLNGRFDSMKVLIDTTMEFDIDLRWTSQLDSTDPSQRSLPRDIIEKEWDSSTIEKPEELLADHIWRQLLEGTVISASRVRLVLVGTMVSTSDSRAVFHDIYSCKKNRLHLFSGKLECQSNDSYFENVNLSRGQLKGDNLNIINSTLEQSIQGDYITIIQSTVDGFIHGDHLVFENSNVTRLVMNQAGQSYSNLKFNNVRLFYVDFPTSISDVEFDNIQWHYLSVKEFSPITRKVSGLNIGGENLTNSTDLYFQSKDEILDFNPSWIYYRAFKRSTTCLIGEFICNGKYGPREVPIKSVLQFEREFEKNYKVEPNR
ncbi:MAG: hypothetical protein KDD61_14710 [Bdellovibrionales bacterium]|nr:hypothetical protein [Bdellovibrionales bacterium]